MQAAAARDDVTRSLRRAAAVAALLLAACATPAPVPVAVEGAGGIGIALSLRGPLGFPTYRADTVYFVKVETSNSANDSVLHASNYSKDGRAYLLNAPPGRYAAVVAAFTLPFAADRYITYLPRDLATGSEAAVAPGEFAYAGSYVVDMMIGLCPGEADEIQLRYAEMFEPGSPKCGFVSSVIAKLSQQQITIIGDHAFPLNGLVYHYRGSIRESARDAAREREFRSKAREDLAGGRWPVLIDGGW